MLFLTKKSFKKLCNEGLNFILWFFFSHISEKNNLFVTMLLFFGVKQYRDGRILLWTIKRKKVIKIKIYYKYIGDFEK